MDLRYERGTISVEDDHWWYRGRRRVVAELIASVPHPANPRILDAGCGSGRNLVELARIGRVTGVDAADYSLEQARARGLGEVVAADLTSLPWDDGTFDLVTCLDVIEHLDDDVAALRELRRVTRADGCLVLSVPARPRLWSAHDEVNHHRRRYTRAGLEAVTSRAGWAQRRLTGFNVALLPAVAAVRAFEHVRTPRERDASDFERTPGWANRALEWVLRGEARLVGAGRDLPTGVSLMGVFSPAR